MDQPYTTLALRLVKGLFLALITTTTLAQNSMIGDGFGGRLWYRPTNYTVGSYSAFSLCYSDPCDSSSNQLFGWGGDDQGELGNGPGSDCSGVPVAIPGMSNVRYFTTGYWMGAIKNDGTGWIWKDPVFPLPTQVITDATFVDASASGVCFNKNDGTVWSIGSNQFGQFGNGATTGDSSAVVQMIGVTNAVRVAVGERNNYVLLADGSVLAAGSNMFGLIGDPSIQEANTALPVPVPGLNGIVDIKAHSWATAALDANGDVFAWGMGGFTGDGDQVNDTVPKRVATLSNIVAISGCQDGQHFLALDAYGNCYAWGDLNLGSIFWGAPRLIEPVLVATDVIDIMAGELFSYIVKADGSLWAAGLSSSCSIWLDQPNFHVSDPHPEFLQLNPSLVAGSCPLVGTTAVPSSNCDGTSTITVSHFGGQEPYQYDIGNGPQSSNTFSGLGAGTFTVSVTDAAGCLTMASCTTDPSDTQPVLDLLDDVTICMGGQYTLPWGVLVDTAGTFTDTIPSASGCDTVRVLRLSIVPFYHAFLMDTVCAGESYTLPSGNVVEFSPLPFLDTVQFANTCDTVYHVSLAYGGTDAVIITVDTVVEPGTTVTMIAFGGTSYSWYPGGGLSCVDCSLVVADPTETTEYCVVVSNNNMCPNDTACQWIIAISPPQTLCTPKNIYIPTAFSPNNSTKNDTHCLYGTDCVQSMSFNIYDRWGNRVFTSSDPNTCWDGTYNGQALDPAVFVYHLSATLDSGESVERQGNITLMR